MSEERTAPSGPRVPPRRPDRAVSAERSGESTSPSARSMRARLARMGTKTQTHNPVLEPLFRAVRANHPKADLALLERAYATAEELHATQLRKSGDPYITHPLAVTTILAGIGMTEPVLVAAVGALSCCASAGAAVPSIRPAARAINGVFIIGPSLVQMRFESAMAARQPRRIAPDSSG